LATSTMLKLTMGWAILAHPPNKQWPSSAFLYHRHN
jgi:hypothetical protein